MYGYPIPTSTSHFVLKVGDEFASNAPHLAVQHITSTNRTINRDGVSATEMTFRFHGVELVQRLVPLNRNLLPEGNPDQVQYYRIEYEMRNLHTESRNVGLQLLLDTMIDDNDAATMQIGRGLIRNEMAFSGNRVPPRILVYRTPGNTADLTGELITREGGAVAPDEVVIGRWPYFHGQIWDFPVYGSGYGDSALMIRWNPSSLESGKERKVSTIYGLQAQTRPGLSLQYNSNVEQKRITVYFDRNSGQLNAESLTLVRDFIQSVGADRILGVIAEGSADYPGDIQTNLWVARSRVNSVRQLLVDLGIPQSRIIPKVRGESGASQVPAVAPANTELPVDLQTLLKEEAARKRMSPEDLMRKIIEDRFESVYGIREWGDPEDRKVEIILHIKRETDQ
ncbi:MAG: OmpA family protein [Leptospiraceae bacterium]|nr:OmpA family protein [Leptospiraceae bacterium]